ncbi:MAG TPA: GNAT family N-acetyltransferase [Thermoanaerobaculia bacterium]|nr:GNAT family N-acetyltransferase [Thermoanaerobaculia bacterium]
MIRNATRADLPRIIELFGKSNDAPYDLAKVADEKCFGAGVSGEPNVAVFGDFAGIAVTSGKSLRILAVDRTQRWRGVGSALLRDSVSRGARIVAAEAGNYFTPGVVTTDTPSIDFFTKRGFRETARTYNLVAELGVGTGESGGERVSSASRDRVLTFIEKEFGRIWRFEAANAGNNLFFVEVDGAIAGFAAHDANNRGLGFFGPTGVARAHRGRGLGAALLRASLADLHRLGYERAIIPWTDALDFYRKACGATVAAQFVTLTRDVDSAP